MRTPRILWVTDEVPDLALGGGSIRQYHLLTRLSTRAPIDLLLAGRLTDDRLRSTLGSVMEVDRPAGPGHRYGWVRNRMAVLPGLVPSEVALTKPVVRLLAARLAVDNYDLVQIEHEWLAPLLRSGRTTRWVITMHNLLSTRLRQRAAEAGKGRVSWLLERDAGHADRLERWIVRRYDRTIAVSAEDAGRLAGPTSVVPNGVDLQEFQLTQLPSAPKMIFTASWNWEPNADAAVWICRELLPELRSRLPRISLCLVGRQPPERVRRLAGLEGVETHFDVPAIRPYLESARIALVPLRVGSGTRLKALEAMASGRPVVGTTIGLEGLRLVDGRSAAIADTVEGLSERIVDLCLDDEKAHRVAAAARRLVESDFGWDRIADRQWQVLQETLSPGQA